MIPRRLSESNVALVQLVVTRTGKAAASQNRKVVPHTLSVRSERDKMRVKMPDDDMSLLSAWEHEAYRCDAPGSLSL